MKERKKVKSLSHVQLFETPWTEETTRLSHGQPTRLLCPWDFSGKSEKPTGVVAISFSKHNYEANGIPVDSIGDSGSHLLV